MPGMTEQQQKWFASIKESFPRETGKTIEEWVAIAKTCPETKPAARKAWFKETHGLGTNRASIVLAQAFPAESGWDDAEGLRATLWKDPASAAILAAVEKAATAIDGTVQGQRKAFTAFSRKAQYASVRPVKGGTAMLGLALEPGADPRLETPKNESWSERLKSRMPLASPADVDPSVVALLEAAAERS
jgi:hypothetical protein